MRRVREIELVGLYPAAMSPCTVCNVTELTERLAAEQVREAPSAACADADLAWRIAEAVFARHGAGVRIRLTPIDSPRGLWLALRHRLGSGLQVLVDGRHAPADPAAVADALGARLAAGG